MKVNKHLKLSFWSLADPKLIPPAFLMALPVALVALRDLMRPSFEGTEIVVPMCVNSVCKSTFANPTATLDPVQGCGQFAPMSDALKPHLP